MNDDLKEMGLIIRRLKDKLQLTDRDFADRAGIGYAQVSRLLNGEVNPTYSTIKAIADALEVHPGIFFKSKYNL